MKKLKGILILMAVLLCGVSTVSIHAAQSIKLSQKKVTLNKGTSYLLKVKGTKKKVTWKTSNKKVAKVSKGKVIAVKKGAAIITAKVEKKSYCCKVFVCDAKLSKRNITLSVGKEMQLSVKGIKGKTSWSTTNKKAVSVKNGTIKGLRNGSATVKAKISGITLSCKVKVVTIQIQPSPAPTPNEQEIETKPTQVPSVTETPSNIIQPTPNKPHVTPPVYTSSPVMTTPPTVSNEHAHIYEIVSDTATCTQVGICTYRCKECGNIKTEEIPALGHKYGDWTITKASSLGTNGERQRICGVCGKVDRQLIITVDMGNGKTQETYGTYCNEFNQKVVDLINQRRVLSGIGPLAYNTNEMQNYVDIRSAEVSVITGNISANKVHSRPNGEWGLYGENATISQVADTPEKAVSNWTNSKDHFLTYMDKYYNETAVSCFRTEENGIYCYYWMQVFYHKE